MGSRPAHLAEGDGRRERELVSPVFHCTASAKKSLVPLFLVNGQLYRTNSGRRQTFSHLVVLDALVP